MRTTTSKYRSLKYGKLQGTLCGECGEASYLVPFVENFPWKIDARRALFLIPLEDYEIEKPRVGHSAKKQSLYVMEFD